MYKNLHSWRVDIQQAIHIQNNLRRNIILDNNLAKIHRVAGVDVAFFDIWAICAICVLEYPGLNLIETVYARSRVSFPYVPGLLTFREGPVVLRAFQRLKNKPDLVIFDGQGICHPRRMGIATHMGIFMNIPTIGCAKSHLYGVYKMPESKKGAYSFIYDRSTGEILGVVLRTRINIRPLFVSCGYKVSLKQAMKLVLEFCPKYRIPQPIRCAHQLAEITKGHLLS